MAVMVWLGRVCLKRAIWPISWTIQTGHVRGPTTRAPVTLSSLYPRACQTAGRVPVLDDASTLRRRAHHIAACRQAVGVRDAARLHSHIPAAMHMLRQAILASRACTCAPRRRHRGQHDRGEFTGEVAQK